MEEPNSERTEDKILARWREIAQALRREERLFRAHQEKYEELVEKEKSFRQVLAESGIPVPDLQEIPQRKRKVKSRARVEDLILQVTDPGETIRAEDVLSRLRDRGIAGDWKHPSAAVRNAMRRSDLFQSTGRGTFERVDSSGDSPGEDDSNKEAPPPGGNGASAWL